MTHTSLANSPIALAALLALGASLAGCQTFQTPPAFDGEASPLNVGDGKAVVPPDFEAVTRHVQCELRQAIELSDTVAPFTLLKRQEWLAKVTLTLDVVNVDGLSPSLAYVRNFPYTPGTKYSLGVGGQLQGTQHRSLSGTFSVPLRVEAGAGKACGDAGSEAGSGIRGDLGLAAVIAGGLQATHADTLTILGTSQDKALRDAQAEAAQKCPSTDRPAPHPACSDTAGICEAKRLADACAAAHGTVDDDFALSPTFTAVIDFQLVYGLNGTPSWTLTHFAGPSAGSLVAWSRTAKNTLSITFSAIEPERLEAAGLTEAAAPATAAAPPAALKAARRAKADQKNGAAALYQQLLQIKPDLRPPQE